MSLTSLVSTCSMHVSHIPPLKHVPLNERQKRAISDRSHQEIASSQLLRVHGGTGRAHPEDGRNPARKTPGMLLKPCGKNYQPQLVIAGVLKHQQWWKRGFGKGWYIWGQVLGSLLWRDFKYRSRSNYIASLLALKPSFSSVFQCVVFVCLQHCVTLGGTRVSMEVSN